MTLNEIPTREQPVEPTPVATIFLPADLAAKLAEIGLNVREQDNRCTADPVYQVQQKVRDYGYDVNYADDSEIIWIYDGYEVDEAERVKLEEEYDRTGREPDGYYRTTYIDRHETVQSFFTEKGAQDYLTANSHNLNEPRIYVDSAYRNREWQTLRAFLLTLSRPIAG